MAETNDPAPDLQPCPFCGGKARLGNCQGYDVVECETCGIETGAAFVDDDPVAFWNRRPDHPDAARLDLVERHGLRTAQWSSGAWGIEDRRGYHLVGPDYPTAREAIDAARGVLEPPKEE